MRALTIPDNINIEEILLAEHPGFYKHAHKFYEFIHSLRVKTFTDCRYKELPNISRRAKKLFHPLNSDTLVERFGSRSYKRMIEILLDNKFIETDKQYIKGKKSIGYKLSDECLDADTRIVFVDNKIMDRKMMQEEIKKQESLSDLNKQILQMQKSSFKFDCDNAFELIQQQYATHLIDKRLYSRSFNQIQDIQNGNHYLNTSRKTKRIFHNYSNIKKDLRKFISHVSRENLVEIDISNSQPFFLACLLKQVEQKPDIKRLIDITAEGQFYEFFRDAFYISDSIERDTLKIQILTMLYCPGYWEVKHLFTFRNMFPNVYKVIESIKSNDYKQFAITLQSLEAELMLLTVAPILLEKQIDFISIHDSFIVQERHTDDVKEIIQSECEKKYGLVPTVKVK